MIRQIAVAIALTALSAAACSAQTAVSLHVGEVTNSDGDKEGAFFAVGVRADRALWRWLVAEAGVARTAVVLTRFAPSAGEPAAEYAAPRWAGDVQLQLQLPIEPRWGAVRPYLGAGYGRFTYRRLPTSGERPRLVGSTRFVTAGTRVDVGRRWGARGELRLRGDDPSFGYFGIDGEYSAGVSYRF